MPVLSMLGVVLLASSCTEDVSASDNGPTHVATEKTDDVAVNDEEEDQVEEFGTVPFSEEHLAEGVEMPDGCSDQNIYVEPGAVLEENELVGMCPSEPADDREFRPSQQIIGVEDDVEIHYLDGEEGAGVEVHHLHCEDPESLVEKDAHNGHNQPVGWPQDWDSTGAMPDPYCHPDYLEIGEWEHLEAFSSQWEGTETSTLVDAGQPQDEINKFLWEQSQARADWTP